jgi:hypothetical protein
LVSLTQEHGGTRGIVVVPIPPSETILDAVAAQSHILQVFHVGQLTFDITTHRYIPRHRILDAEEVQIVDYPLERRERKRAEKEAAEEAAFTYAVWMAAWRARNGYRGPYDPDTGLPL